MSDLSLIPLQDGFETQLSQEWNGATGTVYVLATPSYTPTTTNTYIVVNPGKTNMQIAEITDYDSTAKTLTVSSISFYKGLGISSTQQTHTTGSKVIISDNYQFWADIKTAINSKLDDTGGTMTGLLEFSGTTHGGIKVNSLTTVQRDALTPANGLIIYNTTAGEFQIYQGGAWSTIASGSTQPNASTTVLGKIKTDVTPAGDPVALITDNPKYDALAGTSGTPSSSNKYVTNDDTATAATANKVARRLAGGNITVVTESPGDNTTNAASTAFVQSAIPSTSYFIGTDTSSTYFTTTVPLLAIGANSLAGWIATTLSNTFVNNAAGLSQLGSSAGNIWTIIAALPGTGSNTSFTPGQTGKELRFKNSARFGSTSDRVGFGIVVTASTIHTGQTDITDGTVRFIRNGGTLYAHNSNGTAATSTDVTGGRTLTDRHVYEIVYNPGTDIKFYIDGTLVATHTTNMPITGNLSLAMGANANGQELHSGHPILTIKQ